MKFLRALGLALALVWGLNGAAHAIVMPFLEPDRLAFHLIGGAAQIALAWLLFSRLSAPRGS